MKSAPQFKALSVLDQHTHYLLSSFQSSTFSNMSSHTAQFGKRHTEFALSLFCRSAVKVLNEQGIKDTPSGEQLYELIMEDVFGDEESSSPPKNIPRDDVAEKVEAPEVVQEAPEVVQEVPLAEAPKTLKKNTNLTSKELKKNPLKIIQKELKDGVEVEVEVKIAFPYLAEVDYSGTCQSLKVDGGLFSPCLTRPAKDSEFCKSCTKANHQYGTMEQRSKCSMLCYADPKGKKEISFGTWLKKRGVERAEVEDLIQEQYGISLPDEYWVLDKSKSSRAVKTVSTSSDDEASVEGEKPAPKKAGRPKKLAPKKESVAPVEETKSGASDEEASVEDEKPAPKKLAPKKESVAPVEETKSGASDEEASAEDEKLAPKKLAPKKESVAPVEETKSGASDEEASVEDEKPAPKKESVAPVEETKSGASDEEASETSKQEPANVDKELEVEPISDEEAEKEADSPAIPIEEKNGSVKKLDDDHFLVFWEGTTYVVENEDNCVWEHDSDYEIITYVGEWNPETREVKLDD